MEDPYARFDDLWPESWESVMRGVPITQAPPDSYAEFTKRICFGDLWQRPGLSRREKRLVTMAILCLQGSPRQQKDHFEAALNSGDMTGGELNAFLLHLGFYAGFPRGAEINRVLQSVLEEQASASP
jgi:4-carboxymuconolactone decarboxylase